MLFLTNSLRHHKYALSILLMAGLSPAQTAPLIANINGSVFVAATSTLVLLWGPNRNQIFGNESLTVSHDRSKPAPAGAELLSPARKRWEKEKI